MPPRRPKKKKLTRFSSIPPGASFEDDVQLDALLRPWSLTFDGFLQLVQERYGFTFEEETVDGLRIPRLRSHDGKLEIDLPDALGPGDVRRLLRPDGAQGKGPTATQPVGLG